VAADGSHRSFDSAALLFALFFLILLTLHLPLLRLPYFWDEAGYYVPAAHDLLLHGTLIPQSTPSNAHPPLVMVYLALAWKGLGYAPAVTRIAMLAIAAFSLLGVFRLAQRVANTEVAIASAICTALYPVFFAQSSLAHLDLAAAGLTIWGLLAYVEGRNAATAFWFSLAVLTKETAILAPIAVFIWTLASAGLGKKFSQFSQMPEDSPVATSRFPSLIALLVPLLPLSLWYAYHFLRTSFVFGNPEFFRYNVQATMEPMRILLAVFLRLWQVLGYMNLYLLTLPALGAMFLVPLCDRGEERLRIAVPTQLSFLVVILAYVIAMAVVGGAVLARYMLPVLPLVIIVMVSTLHRRVRMWRGVIAIVVLAFVAALFVNPPYGFSIEDNLAYRDYIQMHQHAADFVEAHYPMARVLTAWPGNDELTRPYLGYVTRPMRVVRIENFTIEELTTAKNMRGTFDVALVFSTKYQPVHSWFESWQTWQEWKTRYFGYHRDVPPAAAAQILGGHIVHSEARDGQWASVIEMDRVEEAWADRHVDAHRSCQR